MQVESNNDRILQYSQVHLYVSASHSQTHTSDTLMQKHVVRPHMCMQHAGHDEGAHSSYTLPDLNGENELFKGNENVLVTVGYLVP